MIQKQTYSVSYSSAIGEQSAYCWIWEVFAQYAQVNFNYTTDFKTADIVLGGKFGPFAFNTAFWRQIRKKEYSHRILLDKSGVVAFSDGNSDFAMTAFYCINCLFERAPDAIRDELNRTEFSGSMWQQRGISITRPYVNECFDQLAEALSIVPEKRSSKVWFSHDIDVIHGAWMQDGKWLLKKHRYLEFAKLLSEHIFKRPHWLNLVRIIQMERKRGIRSAFFLLTEKGRIDKRRINADYLLTEKKIENELECIRQYGNEIGLHKSLNGTSYSKEAEKLAAPWANRNHYLAIDWPSDLHKQCDAGIAVDASLGYAEQFGFRNGYSLPFYPFDLENNQPFQVLEIPLTIMDGTFSAYRKNTPKETLDLITAFLGENAENAVISILWHNTHFTDFKYKGFGNVYEKLMDLVSDQNNQTDLTAIVSEFSMENQKNNYEPL